MIPHLSYQRPLLTIPLIDRGLSSLITGFLALFSSCVPLRPQAFFFFLRCPYWGSNLEPQALEMSALLLSHSHSPPCSLIKWYFSFKMPGSHTVLTAYSLYKSIINSILTSLPPFHCQGNHEALNTTNCNTGSRGRDGELEGYMPLNLTTCVWSFDPYMVEGGLISRNFDLYFVHVFWGQIVKVKYILCSYNSQE